MTRPTGLSPEETLRYYRLLLNTREAEQRIRTAHQEDLLAKATARQKPFFARNLSFWKARSDAEIQTIKQKISSLEEQIAEFAEETRPDEAVRTETEQQAPVQDAPESSAEQPESFGRRRSWGKRKPPQGPG
jgi:hypothetical protein